MDCTEAETNDDRRYRAVKSRYVLKKSVRLDLSIKFKVRLVACGYSQTKYHDYFETYAPTAQYKSFTMLLHIAAANDFIIKHLDVENAFAESPLDETVYMWMPKSIHSAPKKVRLLKSLYGLKQAAEYWYRNICTTIEALGFTRSIHDQCVFIKVNTATQTPTYLVVYVDDVLVIGPDETEIDGVVEHIRSSYTAITIAKAERYLGVELKRDLSAHTIRLSQTACTDKIIADSGVIVDKTRNTPLNPAYDYNTVGDGSIPPIWSGVGQLRYPADRTRFDINATTSMLGQGAHKPSQHHIAGYKHMIKYLAATRDKALVLGGDKEVNLFAYSDASFIPAGESKSRIGYAFFLNLTSGAVSCRTKRSATVAHSSTEAELSAIDETVRQTIWMRGFLAELGYPQNKPTIIYTDSASSIAIAEICKIANNTSHIVVRINFIHQEIMAGTIRLVWISADNQVADILTKALPLHLHEPFAKTLLTGHGGVPPSTLAPVAPSARAKYSSARSAKKRKQKLADKLKATAH